MKVLVVISVFVLAVVVYQTNGQCNTCFGNLMACVSKDSFSVCSGGVPILPPSKCPNGTVCSSGSKICAPPNEANITCDKCNLCNEKKVFACIGYNTFALCLGNNAYNQTNQYICPRNLVCSINSTKICIDSKTEKLGATCPYTDSTGNGTAIPTSTPVITTTPNALLYPDSYCDSKKIEGRFAVSADTTCKAYVSCQLTNNGWFGDTYTCPRSRYFDETTSKCVTEKPARCANGI